MPKTAFAVDEQRFESPNDSLSSVQLKQTHHEAHLSYAVSIRSGLRQPPAKPLKLKRRPSKHGLHRSVEGVDHSPHFLSAAPSTAAQLNASAPFRRKSIAGTTYVGESRIPISRRRIATISPSVHYAASLPDRRVNTSPTNSDPPAYSSPDEESYYSAASLSKVALPVPMDLPPRKTHDMPAPIADGNNVLPAPLPSTREVLVSKKETAVNKDLSAASATLANASLPSPLSLSGTGPSSVASSASSTPYGTLSRDSQPPNITKALNIPIAQLAGPGEPTLPDLETFRYFYDLLPQLIWITNNKGEIVFYNQAWLSYTGSDTKDWISLLHPDDAGSILNARYDCFVRGKELRMEYRIKSASDEYRYFLACAKPMRVNGKIVYWFGTCTDIHDGHAAINHSKQKTSFLANMSHDLRTPLTGIIAIADQLLAQEALTDTQTQDLRTILDCGLQQLSLIDNIMDTCKIEAGKISLHYARFNLVEAVNHVMKVARVSSKNPKLAIKLFIDQDIPRSMIGDKQRVMQILTNLISNAIKFTPDGGIVSLTVGCQKVQDELNNCSITFTIQDTGIGMSPSVLHSIFDVFTQADSTTSRRFGGSGLGLSICKSLTALMNGSIKVSSTEGGGSLFTLVLPFETEQSTSSIAGSRRISASSLSSISGASTSSSSGASNQLGELKEDVEGTSSRFGGHLAAGHSSMASDESLNDKIASLTLSPGLGKLTILVVEDNDVNRRVLCRYLEKVGYTVIQAVDGRQAVDLFLSPSRPKVHLILMDCHMPVLDGFEASRQIRHMCQQNTPPILAVTASAGKADHQFCEDAGMDDIVHKPYRFKDLHSKIIAYIYQNQNAGSPSYITKEGSDVKLDDKKMAKQRHIG